MSLAPIPTFTIRQSDISICNVEGRIGDYPVVVRTARALTAGGFADHDRFPNTWTVYFLVDGQWAIVESARGLRREWSSLDKLEKWLRMLGFRFFCVRNDVDPVDSGGDGPKARPSIK